MGKFPCRLFGSHGTLVKITGGFQTAGPPSISWLPSGTYKRPSKSSRSHTFSSRTSKGTIRSKIYISTFNPPNEYRHLSSLLSYLGQSRNNEMPKLSVPRPPDPRPSKAHPEHRKRRKELEEKHGGYEWVPYLGLALTGLVLAFNVEKDVAKCEKRKEKQEKEGEPRTGESSRGGEIPRGGESSRRGYRGESSRRGDRVESSRRDGGDGDRGAARERRRSLDRDYERERRRDDGDYDRRRIEGRQREYNYYDGGRRDYQPWDGREYVKRSEW